jgi:hypothetical protein
MYQLASSENKNYGRKFMASEIAFSIFGAGYGGFSAGTAIIALKLNGKKLMYKSTLCQGMSTSIAYSVKPFEIKNDIVGDPKNPESGERFLHSLQGLPVKLEIKSSFINPSGAVGDFLFEIYNPNRSEPIYKSSRKPTVGGFSGGGISVLATFKYLDLEKQMNMYGNSMNSEHASTWDSVWNGTMN